MRILAKLCACFAALWLGANAAIAWIVTHPAAQAKLFGAEPDTRRTPAHFNLPFETVQYASMRDAWWIEADRARGSVVFIHGFQSVPDPKSADPAPMLELAAKFRTWGYNSLIINLGYATGAHPYSGGPLEAADINAAVNWAKSRSGQQAVVLWGFSAGGHSALLAAANGSGTKVVADSAFVDANAVIRTQTSRILHLPEWTLGPSSFFFWCFTGVSPTDLAKAVPNGGLRQPVLLFQGTGDRSISPTNLRQLGALTGGQVVAVPNADHIASYYSNPEAYLRAAQEFLLIPLTNTTQ